MPRPLIYLLIAFIIGIIVGSYLIFSFYLSVTLVILILLFLLISFRKKWLIFSFILITILIFLIGAFNINKQIYLNGNDRNIIQYAGCGKVSIEGAVIESPLLYPDKTVLVVNCQREIKDKKYIPVQGKIRLAIPPDLNFQYGDFIRFSSSLKEIRNFQNPGGFDYKRLMNLHGIYVSGHINDSSEIMLIRKNTVSDIRLKLESFRTYLKHIIYKNSSSPQREVLEAITIGNQNEIPADIRDSFSKTGTSHILSISGLHIGMVAAAAFFFSMLILKSSEYLMLRFNIIKIAALAAFLMVLIYAFIAGMGITVMRATLMAFIFLLALLSGDKIIITIPWLWLP